MQQNLRRPRSIGKSLINVTVAVNLDLEMLSNKYWIFKWRPTIAVEKNFVKKDDDDESTKLTSDWELHAW